MKETVLFEINGELVVIGYSSMMAPTAIREKNRVFKMLRLNSKIENLEYDVFFFECVNSEWILLPEFGFINLDGPEELMERYRKLPHLKRTTWDEFVELVVGAYY